MASRHQPVSLMRQVRALVQPRSMRRTFASSSFASSSDRDSASSSSSSNGDVNSPAGESSSEAQTSQSASPPQDVEPASTPKAVEVAQTPDSEPSTTNASSTSESTPPSNVPSKRRGKKGPESDDLPELRFDELSLKTFPPLLNRAHPTFDSGEKVWRPPTRDFPFGGSYTQYNTERTPLLKDAIADETNVLRGEDGDASAERESILKRVHLTKQEYQNLHVHVVATRFPVLQTGNGKIQSQAILTVVGNGKGLVGFANEKHQEPDQAHRRSFQQAIRSLEFIKRFEQRTIYRSVVGRFSATTVHLRPRPPGFGLRCPPVIHAIARSAGISDLSASILGSTHPINVCRATLAALGSGSGPTGFGNGIGGPGRRIDRGEGAKTLEELEAERGRRFRVLQG